MGKALPREDVPELHNQASKNPWVIWYKKGFWERMQKTERNLAAIEKAQR